MIELNEQGSIRVTEFDILLQKALNLRSYILNRLESGLEVVIKNEEHLRLMEMD